MQAAGKAAEEAVKAEQNEMPFEVAPEVIEVRLQIRSAGKRYELRHRLRPPKLDDWRLYETELRSTVETAEEGGEALRFASASLEAAAALYDRLFLAAEGYRAGKGEAVSAAQIPVHHKELAVRSLSDVAPAEDESDESGDGEEASLFALDSDRVEVALRASRNGTVWPKLVHVFRAPSAADRIEYSRVVSQALYVRTSQAIKTVLPSRLPGLAALYDRLIEQVRGYAAAGAPLADRTAIVRQMDPLHKKAAVQLLFGE